MPYTINPIVNIGGTNFTNETLNGVSCTLGRTNIDEQPRAGYCTVSIVEFDTATTDIELDDEIQIRVDDSTGADVILWTGFVSDINKVVRNWGSAGYATETRITGIGSLAKLNKRRVGATGYAKEFDGTRVKNIVFETAGITWATVDPITLTWATVDPLLTWESFDILLGTFDTPGDFELTAYSSGSTNALSLAQTMAQSGLGILYESANGKINYSKFTSRADDVALNGFTYLNAAAILAPALTSTSRLSDLVNDVTVTYKNNQTTTDSDATSIAIYGFLQTNVSTVLENLADAQQRVDYYLATRAYPRYTLTQLNLVLSNPDLDDTFRDEMLNVAISKPIAVTNLPPNIYDTVFAGFVEGLTWTISRNELFLTLNVSDYALSQISMNWLQVPASELWNTLSPTLDWANARTVN